SRVKQETRRQQLPEPVFGQIKQARGFRQFLMRGFKKVRSEFFARVHRAQPAQTGPGEESVCSDENDRGSGISTRLRPPSEASTPISWLCSPQIRLARATITRTN